MKIEIKLLFLLVAFIMLAQPAILDAKVLKPGDPGYKDPTIALILGILIPGLGHIYAGDSAKGLMYLLIFLGCYVVLFILVVAVWSWTLWWLLWLAIFALGIFIAIDGMRTAERHNQRGGKLSLLDDVRPNHATNIVY